MRVNTRFLLLAVALALLACNASAQVVPRQDTSGEPDGFDVDGQAERDAEVYLSNEEKSAIQVGNDILAGTDEIPNSDLDYGDETSDADMWRAYPLGWHFVLAIVGGLVVVPLAVACCGPKKIGTVRKEYGATNA